MKKVYIADDGTHFGNENDCLAHEKVCAIKDELASLVKSKCYGPLGHGTAAQEVADFIVSNLKQISEIVEGSELSNEPKWISNLGNPSIFPPIKTGETTIEVRYRNGSTERGLAYDWSTSWCTMDNHPLDIIEYRVLKTQ